MAASVLCRWSPVPKFSLNRPPSGSEKWMAWKVRLHFRWFFPILAKALCYPVLRREGGVSVEKIFFGDSGSKFSVLSPAFYGIWKSRPEGPQFCGFVGVGGAPGAQFWPFGEIWCPKSQKTVRKCTSLIFKWLYMIQEVFQRVKTRHFATYLQAGGSPIIILSSIEFWPP